MAREIDQGLWGSWGLLREPRETLALGKWDSRAASDLPFMIYLGAVGRLEEGCLG